MRARIHGPHPLRAAPRWTNLVATVFHNYGRDQGLPHPVPTALAQDRDGFIWIGTQGGLTRWDGYRFRAYKADPEVAGSLPDDWVQILHVDPAGTLWIGGGAGGLARYDALRDRFVPVPLGPSGGRTHIGAIADDGRGGLWVGTDQGLHHLNPANGAVRTTPIAIGGARSGRCCAIAAGRCGSGRPGAAAPLARLRRLDDRRARP
ncbi:two-component regulator propeller domain-containing protein [Rhizorhabdus histidinilytica]